MSIQEIWRAFGVMEEPRWLWLIPVILFLLFLKKRKIFLVSSASVFRAASRSGKNRMALGFSRFLAVGLMVLGVLLGIAAMAGPQSRDTISETKESEWRVAVLIDDNSGSMAGGGLEKLKKANYAFLEEFCTKEENGRAEIVSPMVGLVVYNNNASIKAIPWKDCNMVRRRIRSLSAGGSTAIEQGLWMGLALLVDFVDKGNLVSPAELNAVKFSLKEREPVFPKRRQEFCSRYQGLSLELFTDGEFPTWAETREKAMKTTIDAKMGNMEFYADINPFFVIDVAHSLCIRTYFWSVEAILPDYLYTFTNPVGMGEAKVVGDLSEETLKDLYRKVALKERSRTVVEKKVVFNPLKTYFIAAASLSFLLGAMLVCFRMTGSNYTREE